MANSKSAKKNILINERNRKRNIHYKSRMKTAIKSALMAIAGKDKTAQETVQSALKIIDKTAAKGIIKKNRAAKKKSQLMRYFNTPEAIKSNPALAELESKTKPKKTKAKASETKAAPKKAATKKTEETKTEDAVETKTEEKKPTKKAAPKAAKKTEEKAETKTEESAEKTEEEAAKKDS